MMRVGSVSSVDGSMARVYFPDIEVVSYPLQVVWHDTRWIPKVNDQVLCYIDGDRSGYIIGKV